MNRLLNPLAWHMAVIIPARNEERLLSQCLVSVKKALLSLPDSVTHDLIVVVDSSQDRTYEIATREVEDIGVVVRTNAGAVGESRGLGTSLALRRHRGPRNYCWLANTDADCIVPKHWLHAQLSLAKTGVEAIAGTIDVQDFEGHEAAVEERFRRSYLIAPDGTHPHVHGANVGFRADVYLQAGGWSGHATGEDHDLWRRISGTKVVKVSVNQTRVITSGRRTGRAPCGFAAALAAHNESVA